MYIVEQPSTKSFVIEKQPVSKGLKKVLGLPALFIIAIGLVVSQTSIVSVLQGGGLGGGTFLIAILLAFVLTVCYISTYSELSLMLPKAGSISTYTAVSIGHFAAIIAALAAYIAPAIFSAPAELLLLQHILDIYSPGSFTHIALLLLWIFTILNILGIDLFASIQGVISSTMLVTLFVIGFEGLRNTGSGVVSSTTILHEMLNSDNSVFSLILVALWPFISFEVVCDLIEEAKSPRKDIPRAMFYASFVMLIAYSLLAYTAIRLVPAGQLANSDIPHWALGKALFGNAGKLIVIVLSITTTCGMISANLAAIPRMLYGMAHHKQVPAIFMRLHRKWKTPWFGILFLSALITLALLIFGNNPDTLLMLLISAASCWLLAYIIAHVDLIVLRRKHPGHTRPYKSPLFPLLQIIGITGMLYVMVNNAPTPQLRIKVYYNAAIFIGVSAIYAYFWVRFKMKKGLLETESMTQAIKD
jgi:amino acid transporter